jgi:hypothetical protein
MKLGNFFAELKPRHIQPKQAGGFCRPKGEHTFECAIP